MSHVLLQIDGETLDRAIAELGAKIEDLTTGSSDAPRHFEAIIGSDGTPDLTAEERIARLDQIRQELQRVMAFIGSEESEIEGTAQAVEDPGVLSEHAIVVLTEFAAEQEPIRLDGPHILVGRGMPSVPLYQAASIARARLSTLLLAMSDDRLPEPQYVYLDLFEAYEAILVEEGIDMGGDDDIAFCQALIGYLSQIIDNLQLAWDEGIAIPECLFDCVLGPLLEMVETSKLH